MRRSMILVVGVTLVIIMLLGSGGALSSPGSGENTGLSSPDQPPLSPVHDAASKLSTAGALDRAYFGGLYVDEQTGTVHIGLTKMEGEHTEVIEAIVSEIEGAKVEFFEVRFTMRELGTMESQIRRLFGPDRVVTLVDVWNNSVIVALKDLTPADVAAIWEAVGEEAPIQICDGWEIELLRTGTHRPLLGGIKLTTRPAGADVQSTLGFRAEADGELGFVMTGHAGGVGDRVWQPTSWIWNRVGIISANPPGHRFSDAAFVTSTVGVDQVVWPQRNIADWTPSYVAIPGTVVGKEGITTGSTAGIVVGFGSFWMGGHYLFHQVVATYDVEVGDSGGPVFAFFVPPDPNVVTIVGVNWGKWTIPGMGEFGLYSPIEGVGYDLDLEAPFSIQGVTGLVGESYWGMPLQGAEIYTQLPSGHFYIVYSSDFGSYRMLLAPGTYSVTATYPMHHPKTYNVQVVSGQFATLHFSLDPEFPGYPYPMGMPERVTAEPQ